MDSHTAGFVSGLIDAVAVLAIPALIAQIVILTARVRRIERLLKDGQ